MAVVVLSLGGGCGGIRAGFWSAAEFPWPPLEPTDFGTPSSPGSVVSVSPSSIDGGSGGSESSDLVPGETVTSTAVPMPVPDVVWSPEAVSVVTISLPLIVLAVFALLVGSWGRR